MNRPMHWYFANPLNPTVLHLHVWVQSLGDGFGDDRSFVMLQYVNLAINIVGQLINFGTFSIKEVCNTVLFIYWSNRYKKTFKLIHRNAHSNCVQFSISRLFNKNAIPKSKQTALKHCCLKNVVIVAHIFLYIPRTKHIIDRTNTTEKL